MIINTVQLPFLALDGDLRVQQANNAFYNCFQVTPDATVGQLVYELGNGQWDIARLRELLERILPEKEIIEDFEVQHDFESIGSCTMLLNARRIEDMQLILLSIENVTERKATADSLERINLSLEKQVEERVQMSAIMQDAAMASNKARSAEDAMQAILKRICDFNHWIMGHAYRRDPEDPDYLVTTGIWYINQDHCLESQQWERWKEFQQLSDELSYAKGEGVPGRVFNSGNPLWIEDLAEFEGFLVDPRTYGLSAMIAFPVQIDGDVVAVLECFSDKPIAREPMFMEIMVNVGIQIGHVIERTQLELQIEKTSEREQRRIGNDMHDGIGQELSGLRYIAQTLVEALAKASSPHLDLAQRIAEGLGTVQQQLRSIIRDLVPVEVDHLGFTAALQALAERTHEMHDMDCFFACDSPIKVEDNLMATQLYRIVQEAVSNAVSHAKAHSITIQLGQREGRLEVEVSDDGVGYDPNAKRGGGFGLRSMAYRARLIGANLTIEPAPSGGTKVVCRVLRKS